MSQVVEILPMYVSLQCSQKSTDMLDISDGLAEMSVKKFHKF